MEKKNIIQEKTFEFALIIIELFRLLQDEKEFILSKQLLRSGTSIGANVEEAIAAHSKKDFVYKMAVASKEARETKYWLKLLSQSKITRLECQKHLEKVDDIINILTKIVKTSHHDLKNE